MKKNVRSMLRTLLAFLVLAAFGGVIIYEVTKTPPPKVASSIQARLELAAGDVRVDQGSGEAPAVSGTPLLDGAKIRAGKGARALVRLPDGSTVFLRGGTAIALEPGGLSLSEGEYWLDAPPLDRKALVHRAGDVTLTAVDAGLDVRRKGAEVVVYVARGSAVVSSKGGRAEPKAGEQARVDGAKAPAVAPLPFFDDWTGGLADFRARSADIGAGSGAIFAVDRGAPGGRAANALQVKSQTVRAVVREGLSETTVDQTFFNPGPRQVEGWYWFTVPERASVTGFALETNGRLVEGEFIERREAAKKYGQAKASGHAPAILEWIDGRTYRARIFPIAASGTRRVVLRYIELRPVSGGKVTYTYPMGGGAPVRIGEFSLAVDLGEAGKAMEIATLAEARVESGGSRVTMRRSGFTPRAAFQLEAKSKKERPALSLARYATGGDAADYVMLRYSPQIEWTKLPKSSADVVVVVDTSAAGDEAARLLRTAAAEAILRGLSDSDRFALVSLDVRPTVLHPEKGLAPAKDGEIARALERLAEHESAGATDLASLFDVALARVHGAEQPAVVYVGDGRATSGERRAEQLIERMRRALSTSRARLFSVAVGAEADHPLLGELARAGAGESFRLDDASGATATALELVASVKRPTITEFSLDVGAGLDEPFMSAAGKVSRGSEVVLLARTHHKLPDKVKVKGRVGGKPIDREVEVKRDASALRAFVPRLWAAEYVRRLLGAAGGPEIERGRIAALGIEYGLMTPFTSILALESESAYRRMGIERRRSPLRGVRLSALTPRQERELDAILSPAPRTVIGCSRDSANDAPAAEPVAAAPATPPVAQATAAANAPSPSPALEEAEGGQGQRGPTAAELGRSEPADGARSRPDQKPGGTGSRAKDSLDGDDGPWATPKTTALGKKRRNGRDGFWRQPPRRVCSDTARRPLAHRIVLWRKRLRTATSASELIARHRTAAASCELGDWRAERIFLTLLQRHIKSEGGANLLLAHLGGRPEVQKFAARLMLSRTTDPRMVAAIERQLFGGTDWAGIDRKLTEIEDADKRLVALRKQVAKAPSDPNGTIRLVEMLARMGRAEEALSLGRRLRDQGLLTIRIARQLGDVLARTGHQAEAVRTYSEIVEFDPDSAASRQLLGDIYLGRGWYGPAYRQYGTLTESEAAKTDPLGWLRLAAAAAGTGRVDEALRLERKVASGQGSPGPDDPRVCARLMSAARLARLLHAPPADAKGATKSIERKLKELQLLRGPGTLVVLTWEQLDADLALVSRVDDTDVALGEHTDAASIGLSATLLAPADFTQAAFVARLASLPRAEPVALTRHDIGWDGKAFTVKVTRHELKARATKTSL